MQRVVEQRAELLGVQPSDARRSGRPTSPMKSVSPVSTRVRVLGVGREVVDEDRDRLRRVAGRLERLEPDRAELDRVAVGERRELVLGLRPRAEVDRRPDPVAQLQVAGEEVGVQVGQQDVLDPAARRVGVGEVLRRCRAAGRRPPRRRLPRRRRGRRRGRGSRGSTARGSSPHLAAAVATRSAYAGAIPCRPGDLAKAQTTTPAPTSSSSHVQVRTSACELGEPRAVATHD